MLIMAMLALQAAWDHKGPRRHLSQMNFLPQPLGGPVSAAAVWALGRSARARKMTCAPKIVKLSGASGKSKSECILSAWLFT